ncbi:hypothetical protein QJS10_CPB20g00372 [Acorus calamus]|uniref:Pentatricopeptide repeat-containing protein n=1 Tax=Acorus calamus TaxID=4465 RepID=A0AAV9C9V9_ACOCL|nr:hypothetical protein QJS10_CPB20g00372 [Acorus calamus]
MGELWKGCDRPIEDLRGLARLLKALVGAGEGELVREVYEAMKRGGVVADEFVFRVLKRGLKGVDVIWV